MAARVAVRRGRPGRRARRCPTDLDAVVHCAGDVSFDPPVDEGFTHQRARRPRPARPDREAQAGRPDIHYVHISTAYVAGPPPRQHPRGVRSTHDVDLEAELAWGLGQRQAVEHRSRGADVLTKERKKAEKEHSRAGLLTAARATEEARKQWVKDELVRIGTERARSLGWTDCYTFTKALGERVVEEATRRDRTGSRSSGRASSSPPSRRPHPGWIEGFKMAEPLILAYGRGELPEFPAPPDTIVDIVPVDHVVAAIVAVLAHPPGAGRRRRTSTSPSGDRNPLTFRALYERVRELLRRTPVRLPATAARPGCPSGGSPARSRSSGCSSHQRAGLQGRRLRDRARAAQRPGPRPGPQARPAGPAAGVPAPLPRPLQEYAQAELRFSDEQHDGALPLALAEADQETFAFDTAVVDWHVLPPGRPLPGGHRADPPARRGPRAAQEAGRPPAAAGAAREARASRRSSTWTARCCPPTSSRPTCGCGCASSTAPSGSPSSAGSPPRCRAWSRPSAATAATSCARSTASTTAPGSPTSTRSPTSTSPTTCCPGSRRPPYAGSASTARPATRRC